MPMYMHMKWRWEKGQEGNRERGKGRNEWEGGRCSFLHNKKYKSTLMAIVNSL